MPHCAAFGCSFQSKGNKGSEVSLHSFPRDGKVRKIWENACGRVQLPKDARLCSLHFTADSFEDFHRPQLFKELTGAGYKRRLKPNAVPTIFPHKEPKRPRTTSENRSRNRERREALATYLNTPTLTDDPQDNDTAMEETDTAAFEPSRTSVSVQCSPIMVDTSTQTDAQTSEAAVQWQAADVLFPSSVQDHSYSCKPADLDQHNVGNSQDLFPSHDDSSDISHSQCSESDPDFIASLSGLSQSTFGSQTSTTAASRVFFVFEEQLKELLRRCLKCGALIIQEDIKEMQNEGSQLTLELTCANNCTYRWQSQPCQSGTKGTGNLLLAASVFFSGIHFAKFERLCCNMNLKSISEDTYMSLRKKFVFPVVKKAWINEQSAVLASMKSQEEVVLCGDGRCDSPGHSAKYCTYTFLDTLTDKVVDFKVVSVSQVPNSNAMELQGFKDSLKTIEENEVHVSTISTDRHPQIVKEMRVNNPEKVHEFDPWHVAKGVSKKLTAEARRRVCDELGAWIPSIINHLWWSAQTCGGDAVLLREKWVSVIHHVTNRHDWPGNRHYHQCGHEPLGEVSQRSKLWLKPGSEAHSALVKVVTDKRLLKDLEHLTKCVHTTTLEVYHSMYLKYLPKRTHFGYDVMVHGSMLAALDHNNNVNREQAVYQDGENIGEPKYKISWSKVHKSFRARPVAVGKDYSYMAVMMADVISSAGDPRAETTAQNPAHIMAPQERLPRSQIIIQSHQYSRFK